MTPGPQEAPAPQQASQEPGLALVVRAPGDVALERRARCVAGQTNLCETVYDEVGFTRDGVIARQVAMPAAFAHRLDPGAAAEDVVLTEPAAVVYTALSRAAVSPGHRVLVIGDGTVALLAVALVRLWSPARAVLLGRRVLEAAGTVGSAAAAIAAARRGGTPGQFAPGFLITHRFPLADWQQAVAVLRHADGPRGKVLLTLG